MQNCINLSLEIFFQDVLQELTIMVLNLKLNLIFIIRIMNSKVCFRVAAEKFKFIVVKQP